MLENTEEEYKANNKPTQLKMANENADKAAELARLNAEIAKVKAKREQFAKDTKSAI